MPRLFIIMGGGGTRKSSTIRALTGTCKRGLWNIATTDSRNLQIYIQLMSLQEAQRTPEIFISKMRDINPDCILVPLGIGGYKYPHGVDYIRRFINEGWDIEDVVVLGSTQLPNSEFFNSNQLHFISNSREIPSNQIAAEIRERWNWL